MSRFFALMLCLLVLLLSLGEDGAVSLAQQADDGAVTAAQRTYLRQTKLSPDLYRMMENATADAWLTVLVKLNQQADLHDITTRNRQQRIETIINRLQQTADQAQRPILDLLANRANAGTVAAVEPFWIFNGLLVTAKPEVIDELATLADVRAIELDVTLQAPTLPQAGAISEPNLALVNAPALWERGYLGQSVVVANLDTGVDVNHPDLVHRWRGGENSWFDAYGEHATPVDFAGNGSGHGTWTMGVMVGGASSGSAVGIAPDAQWIAAKIFSDQGTATAAAIHAAYQWLLDPDGNPATPDAPHVVNNSWTFQAPGCNLEFEPDLQALRTAGILPVFAAGNGGPSPETSFSPGNNPAAFAVGGVNSDGTLYTNSSRGPAACGEAATIYPEIVAPAVEIHTTDLYGLYHNATGTSMAAPHVSGALALLLSAVPHLTAEQQAAALLSGTVDLGPPGPDSAFGYGRLDLLAAYQWLNPPPVNQPPVAEAGVDQQIKLPATATLAGTATDDGLPDPPGNVSLQWSLVSGPAAVVFADETAGDTVAGFGEVGEYLLRLTADDGALQRFDDLLVTVTADQLPTTFIPVDDTYVDSSKIDRNYGEAPELFLKRGGKSLRSYLQFDLRGIDQRVQRATLRLFSKTQDREGGAIYETVRGADAPQPSWAEGLLTWNNAPAVGRFVANIGAVRENAWVEVDVTAAVTAPAFYTFVLAKETRGRVLYSAKEGEHAPALVLVYGERPLDNQAPTVDVGPDQTIVLPTNQLSLVPTVRDDGLPHGELAVRWQQLAGPSPVTFADIHSAETTVTFPQVGTYILQLTVSDGAIERSASLTVIMRQPTAAVVLPPAEFYLTLDKTVRLQNLGKVQDEDIVGVGADGVWVMVFRGADVGVPGSADIDAFDFIAPDQLLLSFDKPIPAGRLHGLAVDVDDSDVVLFTATSWGPYTAGTFSLYFDGSAFGLTTNGEDVDALASLETGELVLSTSGTARLLGDVYRDADLFLVSPTTPGSDLLYFDGSDVSLTGRGEDVNALAMQGNQLYLSMSGSFIVDGANGDDEDIVVCRLEQRGQQTLCTYASFLFYDGSVDGLNRADINGLDVP